MPHEQCTDNNPCEVGPNGEVTSEKGRGYGQQVYMITDCLAKGSRLDLSHRGCTLTGATPRSGHRDGRPSDQGKQGGSQTYKP